MLRVASIVLAMAGIAGFFAFRAAHVDRTSPSKLEPRQYAELDEPDLPFAVTSGKGLLSGPKGITSPDYGANVVTDTVFGGLAMQSEPGIAVDPKNVRHIVICSNTILLNTSGASIAYRAVPTVRTSFDGGVTWIDGFVGLGGFDYGSDPTAVFDSQGNVYLAYLAGHLSANFRGWADMSTVVCKSVDGGVHFDQVSVVHRGSGAGAHGATFVRDDKPWMTIDKSPTSPFFNRIYVTWQQFVFDARNLVSWQVYMSYSSDGGSSWSPEQKASNAPADSAGNVGPAVGPDGTLYIVYNRYLQSPFHYDTLICRSEDGGRTLSTPVTIIDNTVGATLPWSTVGAPTLTGVNFRTYLETGGELAVAPDGTVWFVFFDNRNGTTDATNCDVFICESQDRGETWTAPFDICANTATGAGDQFFPFIDISKDGTLNVAYYDDGYDPLGISFGVTLARSKDGTTWNTTAVQTGLSDPGKEVWYSNPWPNGQTDFIGDYIGIAVDSDGRTHAAWTDLRQPAPAAFQTATKTNGMNIVYGSVAP